MMKNPWKSRSWRRLVLLVLASLFVSLGVSALADEPPAGEIPATIYGEFDFPIWVSAEAARGEASLLNPQLFADYKFRWLQEHIREEPTQLAPIPAEQSVALLDPEECVVFQVNMSWPSSPTFDSFSDLANEVKTALKGVVVDLTPGFYYGTFATLLSVQTERLSSSDESLVEGDPVHLIYPRAAFRIGSTSFCSHHREKAAPVEVGSELVMFLLEDSVSQDGKTFVGLPALMAVTNLEGAVIVGEDFLYDQESRSLGTLAELYDSFELERESQDE